MDNFPIITHAHAHTIVIADCFSVPNKSLYHHVDTALAST